MAKTKVAAWEVSDAFWQRVEPLIPAPPERATSRKYRRKPGGGRKRKDPRLVLGFGEQRNGKPG
jgi:hypothetical protein